MPDSAPFRVSLTYDIEMCTNFPYWTCVWDHIKGAIQPEVKVYIGKLADLAAEYGVRFQWFVVGSAVADDDIEYLRRLTAEGHAVGNHTWRHVNVKARTFEQLQITYQNDPALVGDCATPLDVMRRELRDTTSVITDRLGARPRGFRTPGGFGAGLADVPQVQTLLQDEGFAYCSGDFRYPITFDPRPSRDQLERAVDASLRMLQPYRYPNQLLEIPMMGPSDIWAFRGLDLEREDWLQLLERGVDLAAAEGLTYSILMHPAVMAARDPHLATVRRVVERTLAKGGEVVTNDQIAALHGAAL